MKPKKGRIYFDQDVEDAIILYNKMEEFPTKRNKLYSDEIAYAFDKLAENIINTFKFPYFDGTFEDVKQEVISFLVMNMHKYDHTKGSKAFSYFSVVAKNYLILHNNNAYKKLKIHDPVEAMDSGLFRDKRIQKENDDEFYKSFRIELIEYFESNIPTMFKRKRDITIAYAIVELMHRFDELESYNKKNLYILIREMTGVDTVHITKIINIMKKKYKELANVYFKSGTITNGGKFF